MVSVIVIVSTILVIGLVSYFVYSNNKKQAWEGELVEKRIDTYSGGNDNESTQNVLIVKKTDGRMKKVYVSEKVYRQFILGDKLIKAAGETSPKKIPQ
jgi:hypothetical protein